MERVRIAQQSYFLPISSLCVYVRVFVVTVSPQKPEIVTIIKLRSRTRYVKILFKIITWIVKKDNEASSNKGRWKTLFGQ